MGQDKRWELTKRKIEVSPEIWTPKPKKGTGFEDKTRWDWLQLIIQAVGAFAIPISIIVLIVNVNQFNAQQSANATQALEQQRQTTLDTYLDRMQELLLQKPNDFKAYKPGDQYQAIAEARTLTALRNLDGNRKGTLIRFLWEANLIIGSQPIISLTGANLIGVNFSDAQLSEVNLSGAFLSASNLVFAHLSGANLSRADLGCAELDGGTFACTDLSGADLGCTDPSGGKKVCANLSGTYLEGAKMDNVTGLRGTILQGARYNTRARQGRTSDGLLFTWRPTLWPQGFDPKAAGAICVDC